MNHSDISCRVATRLDVESLLNLFPQITSRPHSLLAKTLGLEDSIRIFDEMSDYGNIFIVVGESDKGIVAALIADVCAYTWYAVRTGEIGSWLLNEDLHKSQLKLSLDQTASIWAEVVSKEPDCVSSELTFA